MGWKKTRLRLSPQKALHEWRAAAERGDAEAAYLMGLAHELGRGTKRDLSLARQWYERAKSRVDAQRALQRIAETERLKGQAHPIVTAMLILLTSILLP